MKTLLLLAAAVPAQAAVLKITAATYNGTVTAGSPQTLVDTQAVSSITTTEGTFGTLAGATAVTAAGQRFYIGTDLPSDSATLVGLTATDGLLNLTSTSDFQLGTLFNADTRFFLLEVAGAGTTLGDVATISLLNAGGTPITGLSLTLAATDFGGAVATFNASREGNTALNLDQGGLTFALSDFTGTGDASLATGIRISSASNLDPAVVGTFTIPEPSALLLGALGLLPLLRRKR